MMIESGQAESERPEVEPCCWLSTTRTDIRWRKTELTFRLKYVSIHKTSLLFPFNFRRVATIQFPISSIHRSNIHTALFTSLHCALAAAQCTVIGPVCLCFYVCLCVCGWVCYHDNSKLRASILTKLGLYVKVVTISS